MIIESEKLKEIEKKKIIPNDSIVETFFKDKETITKEEFLENIENLKNLQKDESEKDALIDSNEKLKEEINKLKESITKEKQKEIEKQNSLEKLEKRPFRSNK